MPRHVKEEQWVVDEKGALDSRRLLGIFTQRTTDDMRVSGARHWRLSVPKMKRLGVGYAVFFRNSVGCPEDDVPHGHIFGVGKISAIRWYPLNEQGIVRKGLVLSDFAHLNLAAAWGKRNPIAYGPKINLPECFDARDLDFEPIIRLPRRPRYKVEWDDRVAV